MKQEDINKAFENRWRIKGGVFSAEDHVQGEIKALCLDFFTTGIVLGEYNQSACPVKNTIELRSESFRVQVFSPEYMSLYPRELLTEFFDYWSEPNRSNTKLRFENEKSWDLSRRLRRWAKNDYSGYVRNHQQQFDKLADILTT